MIQDLVNAFAELSGFTIELDADGYTLATSAADTLTITWAGGTDVRDLLGYEDDGATTSVTTGGTTSGKLCRARWAPARPWRRDEPVDVARKSMSISTDGTVDVISAPPHKKRRIAMRFSGGPREAVETEFSVFRDVWERIVGSGRRFRFYSDRDVLTEYAEITNPWGWQLLIVEGGGDWDPGSALTVSGWYGMSEYAILARLVV